MWILKVFISDLHWDPSRILPVFQVTKSAACTVYWVQTIRYWHKSMLVVLAIVNLTVFNSIQGRTSNTRKCDHFCSNVIMFLLYFNFLKMNHVAYSNNSLKTFQKINNFIWTNERIWHHFLTTIIWPIIFRCFFFIISASLFRIQVPFSSIRAYPVRNQTSGFTPLSPTHGLYWTIIQNHTYWNNLNII